MYGLTKGLAEQAARMPAKRWATVAPNYVFGRDTVKNFKMHLKQLRPDVEFVEEQWPTQAKINAASTVEALKHAKPDAVFNALFSSDNVAFVREGRVRGLFDDVEVISVVTGFPEELDALGAEAPKGWLVNGYPWDSIRTPVHKSFVDRYRIKYGERPILSSVWGYLSMKFLIEGIREADSTKSQKIVAALKDLKVLTPIGYVTMRGIDHRSTMGMWLGKTDVVNGKAKMVNWMYLNGSDYMPSDEYVMKLRGMR